ncbi:MAG: tetratricopeptide repeat protein, partial [Nitrospiraceae bacterium]|nr:tetratricopeptide repeat protein [Nitrospiraceae bacterium]
GVILFKKGDLQGALADLKEALELNPNPVLAYYELGNVYLKMGQPQKALEAYKKGIEKLKQGRHAW